MKRGWRLWSFKKIISCNQFDSSFRMWLSFLSKFLIDLSQQVDRIPQAYSNSSPLLHCPRHNYMHHPSHSRLTHCNLFFVVASLSVSLFIFSTSQLKHIFLHYMNASFEKIGQLKLIDKSWNVHNFSWNRQDMSSCTITRVSLSPFLHFGELMAPPRSIKLDLNTLARTSFSAFCWRFNSKTKRAQGPWIKAYLWRRGMFTRIKCEKLRVKSSTIIQK